MRVGFPLRFIAGVLALAAAAHAAPKIQVGFKDSGESAVWEEFLRTARIVTAVQMGGPEATTSPWKLTLSKGDITRFGLWKDVDRDIEQGGPDRWRYEIAAYRLDVLLGLGMVPPVKERAFQGRWGSLQLWMVELESLKARFDRGVDIREDKREGWIRETYLERAFDSLIANEDRNLGNILIGADENMILIDHSRSFRTDGPFAKSLVYGAAGLRRTSDGTPYPFLKLPRIFVEKLRGLDAKAVRDAVKTRLTGPEIQALLARRDLVLKEIDALILERGETEVLY